MERKCPRCLKESINGHDACIANLPGVMFACCGHGKEDQEGYILFENGVAIYGDFRVYHTDRHKRPFIKKMTYVQRPVVEEVQHMGKIK